MRLISKLFLGQAILLSSCNVNSGGDYLKLGQTGKTGSLSYTMTRFDNTGPASDKNKNKVEIEFVLHSNSSSYIELNGAYTISFDDPNVETFIYFGSHPSSIAPNSDEFVILQTDCFPDWKSMTIRLRQNSTPTFKFSIRHSDYPNECNYASDYYPRLKNGESYSYSNQPFAVRLTTFETTTIGSAYAGNDKNNMSLQFTLTNNSDSQLSFAGVMFSISPIFDSGRTSGGISISTPNNPQSVNAHSSVGFNLIITASKTWQVMRLTHEINNSVRYSFLCYHSDFPNI